MKKYYDNDLLSEISYLIDCHKFDAAELKYREYRDLYPNDTTSMGYYMLILSGKGNYEEAEKLGKDLLNDKFRNSQLRSRVLISLALVLRYQLKYDDAIKYAKEACEIGNKKHVFQIKLLVDCYSKNQNFEDALQTLENYREYLSKDIYNNLRGDVEFSLNNIDEAINYLENTNDENLTRTDYQKKYLNLGKCYFNQYNSEKALEYFKKVLTFKSHYYYQAYFYLAVYANQAGHINDAISMLEEIIDNNQSSPAVRDFLDSLYIKKGELGRAKDFSLNLENKSERLYNLGRIELKDGNFALAEKFLDESFIENDFNVNRLDMRIYTLITVKFKLKKYDEVIELIGNNYDLFNPSIKAEAKRMQYYIKYVQGKELGKNSYTARQISNYSEEEALRHIKTSHEFQFVDEIDIDKLFRECKEYLIEDNMYYLKSFDVYKIRYDKLGKDNINNTDLLTVVCVPSTKNILTMFPDKYAEFRVDDLGIEDSDINPPKKKRLSQIEKFNKKYNM